MKKQKVVTIEIVVMRGIKRIGATIDEMKDFADQRHDKRVHEMLDLERKAAHHLIAEADKGRNNDGRFRFENQSDGILNAVDDVIVEEIDESVEHEDESFIEQIVGGNGLDREDANIKKGEEKIAYCCVFLRKTL